MKALAAGAMLMMAVPGVVSCEDMGVTPDVSVSEKSVSCEAGYRTVSVKASGKWLLSLYYMDGAEPWASLTSTSGRGSKSGIILTYGENPSEDSRSLRIILTTSDHDYAVTFTQQGQSSPDLPAADPKWLELPKLEQDETCRFYSHDMTVAGKRIRNYSFLWDRENLVAHWVAYPLNAGLIGDGKRTDDWGYDPEVPREDQPVLFNGFSRGYSRGHQLPSADRYAGGSNPSTFYFTNMTPQLQSLNSPAWAGLEEKVRGWSKTSDTLYVVTGCVIEGSTKKAYDNDGKAVTVPVGYFKALLWYNSHSTYSSRYMGAAFYVEHRSYGSITAEESMSIDDLEEKTGIDFFVNLPARIGSAAEAAAVEAQDPKDYSSLWGLN